MINLLLRIVVFAICLYLLALGALKFVLRGSEPSACRMTYMYQEPEYIPVPLSSEDETRFPQYNLFSYGEGGYASILKEQKYYGIPVLFIPGNSGCHKQVRSLASVAMSKAESNRSPFHFNYFSLDLNNEPSAVFGGVLLKQTEFVAVCVRRILTLYRQSSHSKPTSVILVGHSMGGVVARALFTLPGFDPSLVNVILTQATPHIAPVAEPDLYVTGFYNRVNSFWTQHRNGKLKHVNVVSVGGGNNDMLVRSDLVRLPRVNSSSNDLSIVSTAIPGIWTSMDHLCIVWCNQLVLSTVRATFRLVDPATHQIMTDPVKRAKVLEDFFLGGAGTVREEHWNATRRPSTEPDDFVEGRRVAVSEAWTEVGSHYKIYKGNSAATPPKALLLPVEKGRDLIVLTSGVDVVTSMAGCQLMDKGNSSGAECKVRRSLECCNSLYVPTNEGIRKLFRCPSRCYESEDHFAIRLPATQKDMEVIVETLDVSDRSWKVSLIDLLNEVNFHIPKGSSYARVAFPDFSESWQAYLVNINAYGSNCLATSHFHVPWNKEDSFLPISQNRSEHRLSLFAPKSGDPSDQFPELHLYLHPHCEFNISVTFSLLDAMEQVIRFNLYLLPVFAAATILHIISNQFFSLSEKGRCLSAWMSVSLWIVIGDIFLVYLTATIFGWILNGLPHEWKGLLPTPSPLWTSSHNPLGSLVIMLFCYLVCCTFLSLITAVMGLVVIPGAKLAATVLNWLKIDHRLSGCFPPVTTTLLSIVFSVVLLLIGGRTCGAAALIALQVFAALRVNFFHVKLYRKSASDACPAALNNALMSVSLYFMWALVLQLNSPALVMWTMHLKHTKHLSPDPSFLSAVFMILAVLCQNAIVCEIDEKQRQRSYWWLAFLQRGSSIAVLVFCLDHIYSTCWLLAINTLMVAAWPAVTKLVFKEEVKEKALGSGDSNLRSRPNKSSPNAAVPGERGDEGMTKTPSHSGH